jgi:hypothetical protein
MCQLPPNEFLLFLGRLSCPQPWFAILKEQKHDKFEEKRARNDLTCSPGSAKLKSGCAGRATRRESFGPPSSGPPAGERPSSIVETMQSARENAKEQTFQVGS